MLELYNKTNFECSKIITRSYSTSFSLGILMFDKKIRNPIYAIYGFVRFADEIVDTFHTYDKEFLLEDFRNETYKAIYNGISLNPVLHSFQQVVHQYKIDYSLIDTFLDSMKMDLDKKYYSPSQYAEYIYGSAEVVGLMCLKVFCEGDNTMYEKLKSYSQSLGAAFQKVNFLRDMKSDFEERGRVSFPGIKFERFDETVKKKIEDEIQKDFDNALKGIMMLPKSSRMGVYIAYRYYLVLFNQIKKTNFEIVKQERIRVSDSRKMQILLNTYLKSSFNLL
jgi:15-cis-phytoene synthase